MNHHELLDVATVALGGLLLREPKFFGRSLDSPSLEDAIAGARPGLDGLATDGTRAVTVDTPTGEYRGAYRTSRWYGDGVPTIVFHHGSGENPFDRGRFGTNSFRRLFAGRHWDATVNTIVLRAPFHDRSSVEYARSMGDLADFVGMLATSTALVEALTTALRDRGCPLVAVSGISLGGWVTNLHRAFHGTADRYVPIFAGAALGEMFVTSVYRRMVGGAARASPDHLRRILDFEPAFVGNEADDCRPLLARYDRIIELDVQRSCYDGMPLAVLDRGHVTGSLAATVLGEHVRAALDRPARGRGGAS